MTSSMAVARRDLQDKLAERGFPEPEKLAQLARPSIRFTPTISSDGDILPGASKIGGLPDLPPGFFWPTHRRKRREYKPLLHWKEHPVTENDADSPLSFTAQINLADSSFEQLDIDLPKHGLLSLFYDVEHGAWGFDPLDKGSWHLAWFENSSELRRAETAPAHTFGSARLSPELFLTLSEAPSEAPENELFEFLSERRADGVQVGGHPDVIQNPMELECEIVSLGFYAGGSEGYEEAAAAGLGAGQQDWRLVLQICTVEEIDMMWGDAGNLYVWMRRDDISHRRFENAWTILQCC